eukprot:4075681-Pyramimonas_sp.AAC.1
MVGYINLCRSGPRQMSPAALAQLGQLTDACFRKWVENGYPVAMKWHAFGCHMRQQAEWSGNP